MFNDVCFTLNRWGLWRIAMILRRVAGVLLPTTEKAYGGGIQWSHGVGYTHWVESPIGVLAFRRNDGMLQWDW